MILNKENKILDDPAYKDFINNFIDRNKNKKFIYSDTPKKNLN